jgi:hypothetical protein
VRFSLQSRLEAVQVVDSVNHGGLHVAQQVEVAHSKGPGQNNNTSTNQHIQIVKEGCENKPDQTLVCLEGAAACFAQSQQPCLFPVVTCAAFVRCIELHALLP